MRLNKELLMLCAAMVLPFGALAENEKGKWTAEQIAVVKNFEVPECLVFDPARDAVFVSNISAKEGEYWSDDGKGFISLLGRDGAVKNLRWLDSTKENPIHAPKGMCVVGDTLYFTDNARLMRRRIGKDLKPASAPEEIKVPGAKKLNDLAAAGRAILVSDTEAGKIHRLKHNSADAPVEIATIEGVNGVTFHKGQIFAVSWAQHEVFEIPSNLRKPPRPFGLASHFKNLDGIEVLDDGTFLVSDFPGNKVSVISPDRKTVRTLIEIESPADIGLDRKRGILYVPQFMKNQIVLFQLKKE